VPQWFPLFHHLTEHLTNYIQLSIPNKTFSLTNFIFYLLRSFDPQAK